MKKFLFILCALFSFTLYAQESNDNLVVFKLDNTGLYKTINGEDYYIIPFPNKTSDQIYQELIQNITTVYVDAKKVLNTVENKQIKIRGYSENIITNKQLGIIVQWSGYYVIVIEIKDGRIKLHAPYVEDEITALGGTASYSSVFKTNFKRGKFKSKCEEALLSVQAEMNLTVNLILGAHKKENDNNW